jgi:Zn-dependent protease with chaperone function
MPDLTSLLLPVGLSAGFVVVGLLMLFALVLLVPRGAWQIVASLALALALPTALRTPWIVIYRRLLTTHWGTREPLALRQGLETLRGLTGLEFDHVLCLQSTFGNGKSCFVLLGARQSTLVISEQVVQTLSAEQLLAVLAHEAAHVALNHGNRMLTWGVPAAAIGIALTFAWQMATRTLVPASFRVVGFVAALLVVQVFRRVYDYYVTRRHEAEADDFATGLVGAAAMLGALEALGGKGPAAAHVHNRWTTHGTWERRSARIRDKRP